MIVADGIHSKLRAQIDPDAKLIADGQTAWRATLPIEFMASLQNGVTAFLNSGAHLVAYKMGQRPELNLVYVSGSNHPPENNRFGGPAKELINAARNWKAWPLSSVQSNVWHEGRAVMIGDAAHAMTPHAAQGGAMAIEDATVLADYIEQHANIQVAFAAFQAKRQPRTSTVTALSKQNRTIYQMGGVMALGRNLAMPWFPPSLLLKRLDWLYGWQG
jgi:salicylate hydroxylase